MSIPTEMAERHGRVLAELAELGLTLARTLHEKALAAETPEAACELGLAFHRISRSVRQTLALEARLERERLRLVREAREERHAAERQRQDGLPQRKARVRAAVERLIYTEADETEIEALFEELEPCLAAAALTDDFVLGPVQAQVDRICADLGLAAGAGREPVAPAAEEWAAPAGPLPTAQVHVASPPPPGPS
jgi:hypothetical protein